MIPGPGCGRDWEDAEPVARPVVADRRRDRITCGGIDEQVLAAPTRLLSLGADPLGAELVIAPGAGDDR